MIIPTGFAQANLQFTGSALPHGAEVTIGLELDSFAGGPDAAANAVANNFAIATDLWATTSTMITLSNVHVKYGPNATGAAGDYATSLNGTYASTDQVPQAAYLIRKNTATGGRQGQGRLFWPGVPLQDTDEAGFLETNLISGQNDGWSDVMAKFLADGFIPVLLRAEDSPLQLPVSITSFSCQPQIATQRRRLRR